MADRPILFSAPMVRALLAGTKTQTRRVIKPQPTDWKAQVIDITKPIFDEDQGGWGQWETEWSSPSLDMPMGQPEREIWRPLRGLRYAVGDRLWVREAWRTSSWDDRWSPSGLGPGVTAWRYEADGVVSHGDVTSFGRLRASMHMPRWASRLTLTVTEVRVQRLQDISEEDARAEGIVPLPSGRFHCGVDDEGEITSRSAITAYAWLWNAINGEDAWAANPWIVAYSFTVHPHNIDAMPGAARP